MKKTRKPTKTMVAILIIATAAMLTSCDIMMDVIGGMATGMAGYNPYGYTPAYTGGTNNNYLLDPNYAIWQTQQQQAQMNAVNQQLIDKSVKQTEKDMEELNRINQQLIETSKWQAEHGINLGGSNGSTEVSNTSSDSPAPTTKIHKCNLCNGSGEVTDDTTNPSFGNTKYCNKCKKTVPAGHYHKQCPSCKGTGSW